MAASLIVNYRRFPVQLSLKLWQRTTSSYKTLTCRSSIKLRTSQCYFSSKRKRSLTHKPQQGGTTQSSWTLNVVCAGEDCTSNTLLLSTKNAGYLFNCGETTQRFLLNNNLSHRFDLINNIFLTSTKYRNIAGILGYLLSTRHREPSGQFIIHGHPNNKNVFKLLQLFTEIRLFNVFIAEWRNPSHKTFEDDEVIVEYVKLFPKSSSENGDVAQDTTENTEYAVAYVVKRKTHADHSRKQTSSSNISYTKQVTAEESQHIKDSTVNSRDITGSFLVIECPSEEYLDSLLLSEHLDRVTSDNDNPLSMIVHMSPSSVIADQRYKEFISRFDGAVHHLFMNKDSPGSYIKSQHNLQKILNVLHPPTFPNITSHREFDTPPTIPEGNTVQAFNGLRFDPDSSRPFSMIEGLYNTIDVSEFVEKVSPTLQERLRELASKEQEDYPEVTFLGTSSGTNNWARSQSGILVQTRKDEYILLDCGEGSLLQLHQLYGSQTDKVLANLQAVFLSHLHYDHIGGLPSLISARFKAVKKMNRSDRLCIVAPKVFVRWVSNYERYFGDLSSKIKVFSHENIRYHIGVGSLDKQVEKLKDLISVKELVPVSVIHTETAYGIVLVHEDGWKLVYSGDCRPTKDLVKYGKDCDILIHEGTFPDKYAHRASFTKHSATGEAIQVSEAMKAKLTVITHISSTSVIQELSYFRSPEFEHIAFAYDFMKIRRSSTDYIPAIKKAIIQIFRNRNRETL